MTIILIPLCLSMMPRTPDDDLAIFVLTDRQSGKTNFFTPRAHGVMIASQDLIMRIKYYTPFRDIAGEALESAEFFFFSIVKIVKQCCLPIVDQMI